MPRELPQDVLPQLIADDLAIDLQYEVKANLTRRELKTLKETGSTWIQPGIESLCPGTLRAFRKGVRAAQNILLLRECRSLRLAVAWNFLYRIPGDDLQEYRDLVRLLPALSHLQAPMSFSTITLVRGSPYFAEAQRFGFRDVRPLDTYGYLYPPETRMEDIGTAFHARWPSALDEDPRLTNQLVEGLDAWTAAWRDPLQRPALFKVPLPGGRVFVHDSRPCAAAEAFLGDASCAQALAYFDTPRTKRGAAVVPPNVLTDLLDRAFVIDWDERYVSLVTRAQPRTTP